MVKNGSKGSVIELWGREFNLAKNGLDEAQVVSFINELISQRDTLVQREEHLSSLTKLAEKLVTEADNLAEEIKTEAIDQGKAEADAFIAKADEQAQQMIEEKRTEIINIANEQAAAIKADAEREAELLLENRRKSIQDELRNFVNQLCSQLVSELDSLKQQAVALGAVFEDKLSQVAEDTSTVTMEAKALVSADELDTTLYEREPEFELEILPPIDITKIMGIVNYLDSLPEVENAELIPLTDSPLILVFLREPIQLIDMLKTLPEVAQVKEDATNTAGNEDEQRKVQIVLSEKTVPE